MKTMIVLIKVLAIISLYCLCTEAKPKSANHGHLSKSSDRAFKCYKNAMKIAQLGGGGQLWKHLKAFGQSNDPSSQTTTALKRKACLTQLTSMRSPLLYIINNDKTLSSVILCKPSGLSLLRSLEHSTNYYKNLLNNPAVTAMSLNMTKLAILAKPQGKTLPLTNGKKGVTPEVMRNYKILDTFRYMTKNLQNHCR